MLTAQETSPKQPAADPSTAFRDRNSHRLLTWARVTAATSKSAENLIGPERRRIAIAQTTKYSLNEWIFTLINSIV